MIDGQNVLPNVGDLLFELRAWLRAPSPFGLIEAMLRFKRFDTLKGLFKLTRLKRLNQSFVLNLANCGFRNDVFFNRNIKVRLDAHSAREVSLNLLNQCDQRDIVLRGICVKEQGEFEAIAPRCKHCASRSIGRCDAFDLFSSRFNFTVGEVHAIDDDAQLGATDQHQFAL